MNGRDEDPISTAVDSLFDRVHRLLHPRLTACLVIPARNEASNIERVINVGIKSQLIDEVIVVDSFSTDATNRVSREAGAHVVRQKPGYKGKGGAIQTALEEVHSDVYVFLDGDIRNPTIKMVDALAKPILDGKADHTIAKFGRQESRVTRLTAKPLLKTYFPEVKFAKPLSGQFAIKRKVLKDIEIKQDWGVEIAKNIDVVMKGYTTKEVDVGDLRDDTSKSVEQLEPMAKEVAKAILEKAIEYDRLPTAETVGKVLVTGEEG